MIDSYSARKSLFAYIDQHFDETYTGKQYIKNMSFNDPPIERTCEMLYDESSGFENFHNEVDVLIDLFQKEEQSTKGMSLYSDLWERVFSKPKIPRLLETFIGGANLIACYEPWHTEIINDNNWRVRRDLYGFVNKACLYNKENDAFINIDNIRLHGQDSYTIFNELCPIAENLTCFTDAVNKSMEIIQNSPDFKDEFLAAGYRFPDENKIDNRPIVKTMSDWKDSGKDFDKYVSIGDEISSELVDYFRNVLPPITDKQSLMQTGDPCDYVLGANTYNTFASHEDPNTGIRYWQYCGECHKGDNHEPGAKNMGGKEINQIRKNNSIKIQTSEKSRQKPITR
jgi:hypothetical protein